MKVYVFHWGKHYIILMLPTMYPFTSPTVTTVILTILYLLCPTHLDSTAAPFTGPPDSIAFLVPASGLSAVANPGTINPVKVQLFDKDGNKIDVKMDVRIESKAPDIGNFLENEVTTDETGLAIFRAVVTNGQLNDTFQIVTTLVIKPERTDSAYLVVGQPLDRLWIFYGDTVEYDAAADLSGCSGKRLPVSIRASKYVDSLPNPEINVAFNIDLSSGLSVYATESSMEKISSSNLVNGQAVIWITATGKNINNGTITVISTDPTVVNGIRSNINFSPCFTNIKQAAYFSDNGFGQVNRAEIYYDSIISAEDVPDSLRLFWPDNKTDRIVTKGVNIMLDLKDSAHLTVLLPEPFGPDTTQYIGSNIQLGISYWSNPVIPGATPLMIPFAIEDSVGPLITNAILIERLTAENDTIVFIFSEPVDYSLVNGNSLILVRDGQETILGVLSSQPKDDGQAVVAVIDGSIALTQNDSIRINPSGSITDAAGNHAHQLNRPVPVRVETLSVKVLQNIKPGTNQVPQENNHSGNCGYGTGTGLAFLPPLFYYTRRKVRRARNQ
jgi:hypothetical protein